MMTFSCTKLHQVEADKPSLKNGTSIFSFFIIFKGMSHPPEENMGFSQTFVNGTSPSCQMIWEIPMISLRIWVIAGALWQLQSSSILDAQII